MVASCNARAELMVLPDRQILAPTYTTKLAGCRPKLWERELHECFRGRPWVATHVDRVALPLAIGLAFGLVLLSTRPAHALIDTGSCTAKATGSVSGQIDLSTAKDWNLVNQDVVNGSGSTGSEGKLTGVTVNVDFFGIGFPIISNSKTGTGGSAGPYTVADFSRFARVVGAHGTAGGGVCKGSIKITVTDVSALGTVAGGGGAVLGVLGLIGLVITLFSSGSIGARLGGAVAGLLSGIGFGFLLQQTGALSPTSLVGLVVPGVGLLAGAVLPGIFSRKPGG